jgi:hypothetical protein
MSGEDEVSRKKGAKVRFADYWINTPLTHGQNDVKIHHMKTIANDMIPADALLDLEHALDLQATGQRDPVFEQRLEE